MLNVTLLPPFQLNFYLTVIGQSIGNIWVVLGTWNYHISHRWCLVRWRPKDPRCFSLLYPWTLILRLGWHPAHKTSFLSFEALCFIIITFVENEGVKNYIWFFNCSAYIKDYFSYLLLRKEILCEMCFFFIRINSLICMCSQSSFMRMFVQFSFSRFPSSWDCHSGVNSHVITAVKCR